MDQPYIFLIANKNCTLLGAVPISLDGGIAVRTLPQEHIGAIIAYRRRQDVGPARKCFLVPHDHPIMAALTPQQVHLCLAFALNFFAADSTGLACDLAFRTQRKKVFKVVEELELSNRLDGTRVAESNFRLAANTVPNEIDAIFSSCVTGMKKDPSLSITLNRFTSSILSSWIDSKVIDMAICLESLFSSTQEISFRFSLYNTLISTLDSAKRAEVFSLLKDLYDTRSKIVHGTDPARLARVEDNWQKLIDVAKLAIAYKLRFLQGAEKGGWDSHLTGLLIGTEVRVA